MPSPAAFGRFFAIVLGVVHSGFGASLSPTIPTADETVRLFSFPSAKREPFFDKIVALDNHPWRYATSGNIEILSRCSDETTRRFANEIQHQLQLMKPVWPARSLAAPDAPLRLFLFKQEGWWEMKTDPNAIPIRCDWAGTSGMFLINAAAYERLPQSAATSAALLRATGNVARLLFDLQLRQRTKDPYWLRFGLSHFYLDLRFAPDSVSLAWPPFASDPAIQKKLDEDAVDPQIVLLPLKKFFDGPPYQDEGPIWTLEAGLFMRWALLAENQKHKAAFWRFAERACSEPVTEALFREQFGISYREAQAQLEFYLQPGRAVAEFPPFYQSKRNASGSPRLRNASAEEMARFKISVDDTIAHQPNL